jgi:hypothetical protein
MTRPKCTGSAEKEALMQAALTAFRNKEKTASQAIRDFNIPRQTFYDRLNGKLPRKRAHENSQLLSHAQEKELVRWITELTKTGYSPRHATVLEMAQIIRRKRDPITLEHSLNAVNMEKIGDQWIQRFIRRHPELATVRLRKMDIGRVKDTSPERLTKWFADLKSAIEKYNILPENLYNMDESGFAIGEVESSVTIINAEMRQRLQRANPGRQEWVTSVECICANGTALPPLIIFKAENLSHEWIPADTPRDWFFSCNTKGWTSNLHGLEWLQRCFEPMTRAKAAGRHRMLICDGHDSHITGDFVEHCIDNNIALMILPAHSSHLTQPLDVGLFSPLKKLLASRLEPLIRTGIARIRKQEFTAAFIRAHTDGFKESNILSGFSGTGIHPFRPPKVLRQIRDSPPPQLITSPNPVTPANPFNSSVLTSSPANLDDVRTANTALRDLIASGGPIPDRAKEYFDCLTRTSERNWTKKTILAKEMADIKAVAYARKTRLSGKRKVIDGESLISTAEKLRGIREAERRTEGSRSKRQKTGGGRRPKAQRRPVKESRVGSDSISEEEVEPFDCIEVL